MKDDPAICMKTKAARQNDRRKVGHKYTSEQKSADIFDLPTHSRVPPRHPGASGAGWKPAVRSEP